MPRYMTLGEIPPKRHINFHASDGARCHEELVGQEGFSAESSLLYHRQSPSALVGVEALGHDESEVSPDRPLVPRHIRTGALGSQFSGTDAGGADGGGAGSDMVGARVLLFANRDLRIGWVEADCTSPLYRNAGGDELVYVHRGRVLLESSFGLLEAATGDYVVVPRSTVHRWRTVEPTSALVLESAGQVGPPLRYRSKTGQFLEHAPYCERDLRGPSQLALPDDGANRPAGSAEIIVRNGSGLSRHVYQHHPFDVVGWDGCVYPWALNISDFEPIVGSIHQPPPVHQTFEGPGFVVCSFVPRPLDFHPAAVKVPYHHSNTDSDELLFYVSGDFTSRMGSGVAAGSITYHPSGFVHGPHPGSSDKLAGEARTRETAVMIDSFTPLGLTEAARRASDQGYLSSWRT